MNATDSSYKVSILKLKPDEIKGLQDFRTERKRNEGALRGNEARKAAILESSLDVVVTIDHQGRVLEFNSAAQKIFVYHRDEVLGRKKRACLSLNYSSQQRKT